MNRSPKTDEQVVRGTVSVEEKFPPVLEKLGKLKFSVATFNVDFLKTPFNSFQALK